LNIRSGEFVYTNAGHNPPYLKRKDGSLQRLDVRHGPMVGAVPGTVYREDTDTMTPGDMLFMYTDGVTEERNADRELFSEKRSNAGPRPTWHVWRPEPRSPPVVR